MQIQYFYLLLSIQLFDCQQNSYDKQQTQTTQQLQLSSLYQFWKGNGVAYQLPRSLRILTYKLQRQVGQIYSYKPIDAGGSWTIEFTARLDCLKYSHDLGMALWLTQVNPQQNTTDYTYQNHAPFFGHNSFTNGLMVLYSHDSIHVGFYNQTNLTREDILYKSKNCRIYTDKTDSIRILIRYTDFSNLSVYFIDPNTGQENLCRQEQEIFNFNKFYISLTGTDKNGQCSGEVKNLILNASKQTTYNVIDYKQKKEDDDSYAYYPESLTQKQWEDFENYEAMFKQMRDDAKIMGKELLEFADKNQKEIITEFKDRMMQQIDKSDIALEIIEKEASALQSLSDYSTSNKREKKKDFNDILEQMLNWMRQLEESFDKVDQETQQMYNSLNEIGLDDKVNQLIKKSDIIQSKLSTVLFKTQYVKKQNQTKSLQTKNLKKLIKNVQNLHKDSQEYQQKSMKNSNTLRYIGLGLLTFISIVIILGFVVMYCRVQKVVYEKRKLLQQVNICQQIRSKVSNKIKGIYQGGLKRKEKQQKKRRTKINNFQRINL